MTGKEVRSDVLARSPGHEWLAWMCRGLVLALLHRLILLVLGVLWVRFNFAARCLLCFLSVRKMQDSV
jgi:hypothetical protein